MMDNTFLPYVGLGPLRFGMTPAQVRSAIGHPPEHDSPRSPATKTKNDYYVSLGLLVEFDDKDQCSSITIRREGRLVLDGVDLMRLSYDELKELLRKLGHPISEQEDGIRCESLGLKSWTGDSDDELAEKTDNDFDCLFIFRRGRDEYMRALVEAWE